MNTDAIVITGNIHPIMIGAAGFFCYYKLGDFFPILRKRCHENTTSYIGRLLMNIPFCKKIYQTKMDAIYDKSLQKIKEQLSQYPSILTIPEKKWSDREIMDLIDAYKSGTMKNVIDYHISGTIYSNSLLVKETCEMPTNIFSYAFEASYLWNSLHQTEFNVGTLIEYQVVQMVGNMFGANNDVTGTVTSGGTESLMCAMRAYRNYGMMERGHRPGESIIIAPDTVHAAVMKAGEAYNIKVILIPTDIYGAIDIDVLIWTAQMHKYELVCIVGSAPCYVTGNIDPIYEMACLAKELGCGFHVDCCLGGFVVNFLNIDTDFLKVNGVTSLSADTHKNGLAPKGSSVLVTRKMDSGKYLMEYSIYTIPYWSGGIYGSIKDNGSTTSVPSLTALVAMLANGQETYMYNAISIQNTVTEISNRISKIDDFIVLNRYNINVIAFAMNPEKEYRPGFIYALAHEMNKRHIVMNNMRKQVVHFCVTLRFVSDMQAIDKFMGALLTSLEIVKRMNDDDVPFPGDSGMYCSLENALIPSTSKTYGDWFENLFFGGMGARDAIRQHFMALLKVYQ
uniref:Sphingosine-1-phosphate lyase n=1 Tax=viral metagenome TaxID=1070528 RepID=A0A6C0C6J2_9ZZZZ